jgi:sulfur-carrier protein
MVFSGFGQGEAFGRDASGQTVKYFAECFAPTAIAQFTLLTLRPSFFNAMAVKVLIPTPLQKFTNEQATISCDGANSIAELLESLDQSCPGIKARLCDDQGQLRRFINFYVNSEDIRFLEGANTPLAAGDEVSIVPAVAGG